MKICVRVEQERNHDLNLGGPKHEPKKFHVTWFIKKKNHGRQKITLYYLNI